VNVNAEAAYPRLALLSREQLETLLHLSQAFNSTLDVGPLLHRILDETLAVTESEAGSLWVVEGDEVRCTHAAGPARDELVGMRRPAAAGSAGEALRTRATVFSANALGDERYEHYTRGAPDFRTRSAVTIPLVAVGEALAVMELVNDVGGKDEFTVNDVAFLELVADDAAAALRNARLLEEARRAHNLRALLEVSHEITATFDLNRVLFSIVNLAGRALHFQRCAVAVRDGGRLHVRAISGESHIDAKSPGVRQLQEVLAWAADRGDALVVEDTSSDTGEAVALRRQFGDYISASGAGSLMVLPIEDAEGELGQLLFEFEARTALDAWTREAAALLANEAALAMRNAQLYADVPFISWLEPLAQRRRAMMAMPRATLLRYGAAAAVVFLLLFAVRLPLRVGAVEAAVHAGMQRPARAGVDGTLASVLVREGDVVATDQLVAVLRNDALQLRLAEVEGDLRLAERDAASAEAVGNAPAAAGARLQAAQLRASLALLRDEAARMEVRAPAPGVVLTPRLEEQGGSYVPAGEPVLWVGGSDSAEIRLRVAQHDVGEIRTGDRVRARVTAHPEIRFDGHVTAVAPRAESIAGVPYYTVRASFENRDGLLRPGMAARARVLASPRPLGYHLVRRPWRFIRMHAWW
jgi:GAF domain-containing protein/multidrug resistance efflux pump